MSVKRTIEKTGGIYFITFTCQGWQQLFELTNSYDAVYKWFDHLKAKGNYITGQTGKQPMYAVTSYKELDDINLTN